jgi:hypothetical protein
MSRHRPVAGIAVVLYLGLGVWMGYAVADQRHGTSGLHSLDPIFGAITVIVYLGGAALLLRNVRAGKRWWMLLVPVAFVPVLLSALIVALLTLGGRF